MILPMQFNRTQALTEIEQRNRLRASSSLPVLDVPNELARLERVEREVAFERFFDSSELYHRAMLRGRYRYQKRNGGSINSISGMELQNCLRLGMRKRFDRL